MKLLSVIGLCALTFVVGGGAVWVADKMYWDNELKVQLAEKDHLLKDLNTGMAKMKTELGDLKTIHANMRTTLLESSAKTNDIIVHSTSAIDKLKAAAAGLAELRKVLLAWEAGK